MKKKVDLDDRKLLEKKNNQMKFYLREIDIDKNLSGSAESLSISSSVNAALPPSGHGDDKNSKGEEFSASFVAQTNWTFVEKLLKVRRNCFLFIKQFRNLSNVDGTSSLMLWVKKFSRRRSVKTLRKFRNEVFDVFEARGNQEVRTH